jgi:hypothetical protein
LNQSAISVEVAALTDSSTPPLASSTAPIASSASPALLVAQSPALLVAQSVQSPPPAGPEASPPDLAAASPASSALGPSFSTELSQPALSKQEQSTESHRSKVAEPADANDLIVQFNKPLLLTPLSPEIIQNQATINVGTIGDVSHGKSTVVRALTGIKTTRFKEELERNITIKLGYANAKVYKCDNPDCPAPGNFKSFGGSHRGNPLCERLGCNSSMSLQRHVSFVDCPGHDRLMVLVQVRSLTD